MNYYILVVDSDRVSTLVKEIAEEIGEKITLLLEEKKSFELARIVQYPVDIVVIDSMDIDEIATIAHGIRSHANFKLIPILVITDLLVYLQLQDNPLLGAIDFIDKELEKQALTYHIRYNVSLSMSLKKLVGENKILKNKLDELENLRSTNQVLYNSTVTLEDLNQELERQRDEIKKQKQEIEIEKRRSEELLLNILPEETSRELIIHGVTKTQFYKKVTVLFTDFKGFTHTCESLPPQDIVNELDKYFTEFDEICENHFVEKIKTIGDSYMCAGGIPMRNNSNPVDVILVGLGIIRYMDEVNRAKIKNGLPTWDVRVGVNTGSIIAGVIGKKKFAYDIWGDTVNTASRMETSGEISKVNISGQTYHFVKDFFECQYRGKVGAKNKGEIDMYFVTGIKPELSVDGLGVKPNKEFHISLARL